MKHIMLAGVLAVMVLVSQFGPFTVDPASATTKPGVNATPYNDGSHPWSSDLCTKVPDSGPTFNFRHACKHHDGCYRYRWASRGTCDSWFRNDMRASCRAMYTSSLDPRRTSCYRIADAYYLGVRAFGASAYAKKSVYIPMNGYA